MIENYDDAAYVEMMAFISGHEGPGAKVIGNWLDDHLYVYRVIDIGCGPGAYLVPFLDANCVVYGVDACSAGGKEILTHPKYDSELDAFIQYDLRKPLNLEQEYDLCIAMEVGEHIEPEYADVFIDSVCNAVRYGGTILLSWAVPGQGGTCHFNEQPTEWTLEQFAKRGFGLHPLQKKWRAFVQGLPPAALGPGPHPEGTPAGVPGWLANNSFLLTRG